MNYISIKGGNNSQKTEKKLTQLIMGSAGLYPDRMEYAFELLDGFVGLGGNTLDAAHQYEGSEQVLGKWLETRKNREKVRILTKGGHPDDGEPGKRIKPELIRKDLYESLERLKTDYVDFYALHRDDPEVEVGLIMETLNEFISSGLIHAIGVSNWSQDRIKEANEYAEAKNLTGFSFNSPNLSLAKCKEPMWPGCVSLNQKGIERHSETGMPVLAWSSQAGGFFSGRFTPDDRTNEDMVRVYYSDDNWERYRRASILAEEKKVTTIQIALAYVINQPFPTAAIIGPQSIDELTSSMEGAQIKLTSSDINWLNLVNESR